jgi:hypothetical protein
MWVQKVVHLVVLALTGHSAVVHNAIQILKYNIICNSFAGFVQFQYHEDVWGVEVKLHIFLTSV